VYVFPSVIVPIIDVIFLVFFLCRFCHSSEYMLELVSFIMWQAISVQMVRMMIVGMMKEVAEAHITHWTLS